MLPPVVGAVTFVTAALVTVIELLDITGVDPLLFVAVTLQDIAFPTSATTVLYVELVAPDMSLDPRLH